MTETIQEKLEWVIPLLYKWLDGGEFRYRGSMGGTHWVLYRGPGLPKFDGPKENYRVLPKWAWELVDAERDGKTIQYRNHDDRNAGPWKDRDTSQVGIGYFDAIQRNWRIKPDPQPVSEGDLSAQSVWEKLRGMSGSCIDDLYCVFPDMDAANPIWRVGKINDQMDLDYLSAAPTPEAAVDAAIEKLMPKK